jgi:hypothetical protein
MSDAGKTEEACLSVGRKTKQQKRKQICKVTNSSYNVYILEHI